MIGKKSTQCKTIKTQKKNPHDGALISLRKMAEARPDSAPVHYNLGLSLSHFGHRQEAMKILEKAAQLDQNDADALTEIGRMEIAAHRLSSAMRFLDKALGRQAHHPRALNNRGVVDFLRARYQKAAQYFEAAVDADPNLADAWFNLADTREEMGDCDAASLARKQYKGLTQ